MDEAFELSLQIKDAERRYRAALCDKTNEPLEIRRRVFGNGGKHLVRQCVRCGEQRGNPLSIAIARAELSGREPSEFDPTIEASYREGISELLGAWSKLSGRQLEVNNPEAAAAMAAWTAEREALAARVDRATEACAQLIAAETTPMEAAAALSRKAVAIRRGVWENQLRETKRFANEDALKLWLTQHLSLDFELRPEVPGTHIATGVRVQIDFLAYPKQHLIDQGFLAEFFGIEVKHLIAEEGFSNKAAKAFWQTVSYTDSKFYLNHETVRLRYAVLFSSMSFEKERQLLRSFGHIQENDITVWSALRQLANHANVGTLEIRGDASAWKGWVIAFSGGRYFGRRDGDDGPRYHLSNPQMVLKNRIGSF